MTPFVIGVAGGSGSGKTTISSQIQALVGAEHMIYLQHDSYYHDQSHLPLEERARINYDHPQSLDTGLFVEHLRQLRSGRPIPMPVYDFNTYTRRLIVEMLQPARVILVEGILILAEKELRELMDLRIFVDTDVDLRFIRRLQRDIQQRGRSLESVVTQYLSTVRPMHLEFVEPSRRYADVIIPEGGSNRVAMEMIASQIRAILMQAS